MRMVSIADRQVIIGRLWGLKQMHSQLLIYHSKYFEYCRDAYFQKTWTWTDYHQDVRTVAKAFISLGFARLKHISREKKVLKSLHCNHFFFQIRQCVYSWLQCTWMGDIWCCCNLCWRIRSRNLPNQWTRGRKIENLNFAFFVYLPFHPGLQIYFGAEQLFHPGCWGWKAVGQGLGSQGPAS